MGRRRLPCDLDFPLRFDGEPVSMSKLTCFLSAESGDRLVIVARRSLRGVDVARKSSTWFVSSEGIGGRVLSTLDGSMSTEADIDDVLGSPKIWLAASTLRGRREEDRLACIWETERDMGGGMGRGV